MDFENLLNFERASTATYYDSEGVLQTAAVNEPRLDHDPVTLEPLGLLIEEERTNILLNSDAPADQTVTLVAGQYVLSVWGTGSASVGAYGSAADGAPLVFTATAGSESIVVTDDLERFQLEQGGFATSYIPTTGSTATRSPDICSAKSVHPWLDENEGTVYIELDKKAGSYVGNYLTISDGTDNNQIVIKDRSVFFKQTNYMPSPFDPVSWSTEDPDGSKSNITLQNPSGSPIVGEMNITSGNYTFIATASSFNALAGEKIYLCFIVKNVNANNVFVRFQSDAGTEDQTQVDLSTFTKVSGNSEILVSPLLGDFRLLQVERTASANLTNADILVYANGDSGQLYVQAAFFGKANDWPAIISDTNIIESGVNNLTGTQGFASALDSGQSKLALSYDGSTYSAAKDGAGFSGTNAGVPALTDLYVGSNGTSRFFNGHIKDVQYYPRKLTESELIELTT